MDIPTGRTQRIGFLLIDGFALMSFAAAAEPLRAANLLARRTLYETVTVSREGPWGVSSSGVAAPADAQVGEELGLDLLLVVAGGEPLACDDERTFAWLRRLDRRGVRLGGVSGGPAILAKAGLMAGRRMTVHWEHAPALMETMPELALEKSLYVRDRDRVTCAGGVAPLDLMHALIAEAHGPHFARRVSDWFLHTHIRPAGGAQRAGLIERYGVTLPPLLAALEAMEDHIADPLSLEQLAERAGLSPGGFGQLFRRHLHDSPMSLYRRIRLEVGQRLLHGSSLTMAEIAQAAGFSDSAHFCRAYKSRYGRTPSSRRRLVEEMNATARDRRRR